MKVLVGMSGGVDSTIAAYILKNRGFDVIGVYFDFLNVSYNAPDKVSAREVANKLGIELIERNYAIPFKEKIIDYFVNSYKNGITPNPCAICNGIMKFEMLINVMKEIGADKIATGHYAGVSSVNVDGDNERFFIKKSKNFKKDQSYMLYRLTQEQLSHLILPISDMDKDEVRNIAYKLELSVADKKDSQDICFIKNVDYKEFIKRYDFGDDYSLKIAKGELKGKDINEKSYYKKGEFVDTLGNVLGYHNGIINYTIGQRKGLNIAFGERKFVVKIDAKNNKVILGNNDDLQSKEFSIKDIVFQKSDSIVDAYNTEKEVIVKLRYRHDGTSCKLVEEKDEQVDFLLDDDVRAITKGQAAVFYNDKNEILYGGIII